MELSKKIAKKNDFLRNNIGFLFAKKRLHLSRSVSLLNEKEIYLLLRKVKNYNTFDEDNDPYGEHDFGSIKMKGETYFFKFEYFDENLIYFKKDGERVLFIMKSNEY